MDSKDSDTSHPESPVVPEGLKAEVTSFLRDASSYLQLRSELFSIEAKEAGQVYGKKTGFIVAGGFLLVLSYLLILAAFIGIIAAALDPKVNLSLSNWTGACLILAGIHLILGFFLFKKGQKTGVNQNLFEYTRNELQKEQEWLKQKRKS